MPASDEIWERNHDYLLTETIVKQHVPVDTLLMNLKSAKTTGTLTFHISEGGINQIILVEKTKASASQREKIREALNL